MKLLPAKAHAGFRWAPFSPLSSDERLIAGSITLTFLFYILGALYIVAPVLGWGMLGMIIMRWASAQPLPQQNATWLIYLWIASALLLLLCLVVGHVDFDLGLGKLVKSTVGWAKGWALLGIFIVLGFCLDLRYRVICRAACVVGLIALLLMPLLVFAYVAGLPGHLYVSPLQVLGGAGAEYFTVILYEIDPFNGAPRWRFFAPWAPAVGFVANIYFLCAWFEQDLKWRMLGLLGNALMIVMAASRMGMLVLLIVPIGMWALSRLTRTWIIVSAAICVLGLTLLFDPVSQQLLALLEDVKAARADSTRVRTALANIALYRWQAEAFWFGHGVVETGTHLVEFMPIGSHHNWYGLLFVKGIIGLLGFLIPFLLTAGVLLVKAQYQVSSRLALGMCLVLGFFSLSENIEALAYLTWPAWLLIGIGLRSSMDDVDTNSANLLGQFRLLSERLSTQAGLSTEAN